MRYALLIVLFVAGCNGWKAVENPSVDVPTSQMDSSLDRVDEHNTHIKQQASDLKKRVPADPAPHLIASHSDSISGEVVSLRESRAELESAVDEKNALIDNQVKKIKNLESSHFKWVYGVGFAFIAAAVAFMVFSKGAFMIGPISVIVAAVSCMAIAMTFQRFSTWIPWLGVGGIACGVAYLVYYFREMSETAKEVVQIADERHINKSSKLPERFMSEKRQKIVNAFRGKD